MSRLSTQGVDPRLLTQKIIVVQEVTSKLGPGEITMTMTIGPHDGHSKCLRQVNANFEHRLMSKSILEPSQDLGVIIASIIDKTITDDYPVPESQRKGKKAKSTETDLAWKRDLLADWPPESPASESEVENENSPDNKWLGGRILKPFRLDALFRPDGRPKESDLFSARALRRRQLCFVELLKLEVHFRRFGLGGVVLRMLFQTLAHLPSPDCFRGVVYLMPGEIDTEFGVREGGSREECVRRFRRHWEGLLGFYRKEGFETWDVVGWNKEQELVHDLRVLGKMVW